MKTNFDFVSFLERSFVRGDRYILGGFGNILSAGFIDSKCRQYSYNAENRSVLLQYIGRVAHDCYGILKAFVWGNTEGQGNYVASQDRNETGAKNAAQEKGMISTIPRLPGIAVWKTGHVGFVVDCSAADYRDWIVIENYGIQTGMLRRPLREGGWTDWFKDTYIQYVEREEHANMTTHTIAKGDTLWALARSNFTTVDAILAANPGIEANNLQVGQEVNLPSTSNVTYEDLMTQIEALKARMEKLKQEWDIAMARISAAKQALG